MILEEYKTEANILLDVIQEIFLYENWHFFSLNSVMVSIFPTSYSLSVSFFLCCSNIASIDCVFIARGVSW